MVSVIPDITINRLVYPMVYLFSKTSTTTEFLTNTLSKRQILKSNPMEIKEKYSERSEMIRHGRNQTNIDLCGSKIMNHNYEDLCQKSKIDKWLPFTQYWSFGAQRGLYIWLHDLPRAMRVFLVAIRAPRDHFGAILVHRVPPWPQK